MHAHEVGDRGTGLLEDLADGLRGVTGEGLVDEAVVLEEGVQATLNNLGNDVGGLTFLERDLFEGSALLVEHVGGNRIAIKVGGHVGGNVHRDVVGDGLAGSIGDDEDANLRGQVGVRLVQVEVNVLALNAHDAANLELLADDGSEGAQAILDGALAHGGGEQRVQVGSLGSDGGGQKKNIMFPISYLNISQKISNRIFVSWKVL